MDKNLRVLDGIHEDVKQVVGKAICIAAEENVEIDLEALEYWCMHAVVTAFDIEKERREEMNAGVE